MQIIRYSEDRAQEWDCFVRGSKNGTFLFLRAYMDYHNDRFRDHSLVYVNSSGKIIAVMAANEVELCNVLHNTVKILYSHQGLTYGGLLLSPKAHINEVGEMFDATIDYLREHGFSEWHYKQMPSVYHKIASEEDTYWLWRNNAVVTRCNMMTAVTLSLGKHAMNVVSPRKHTYCNKLLRMGYKMEIDANIDCFWPILVSNLKERFDAQPVHTLDEIKLLKERFPQNIVCAVVSNPNGEIIAGTLLFITDTVVRTQYISASHEGKRSNAIDFLMLSLIEYYSNCPQYRWLEFGTSMAEDGMHLNDGLILQKEGFGGRAVACREFCLKVMG